MVTRRYGETKRPHEMRLEGKVDVGISPGYKENPGGEGKHRDGENLGNLPQSEEGRTGEGGNIRYKFFWQWRARIPTART